MLKATMQTLHRTAFFRPIKKTIYAVHTTFDSNDDDETPKKQNQFYKNNIVNLNKLYYNSFQKLSGSELSALVKRKYGQNAKVQVVMRVVKDDLMTEDSSHVADVINLYANPGKVREAFGDSCTVIYPQNVIFELPLSKDT